MRLKGKTAIVYRRGFRIGLGMRNALLRGRERRDH